MRHFLFWARWSLRDLRRRWVQVAVIALVIAVGTGVYAGLTSTLSWRKVSYAASYEALNVHDLRVKLSADSFVPEGTLTGALGSMKDPQWVASSEERLVTQTQVEAETADGPVLVPGRVVGVTTAGGGPDIDGIDVTAGTGFSGDAGVVLERHFADQEKLPDTGELTLAGSMKVRYSGIGLAPEYFIVTTGQGDYSGQNLAVVFMPLAAAQRLTGHEGMVNDMVIRLAPGTDREAAAGEVEEAMAAALPQVGTEVETVEEDPSYLLLNADLDNDQTSSVAIALLVLVAAAFAAFTLTSRIVESERREIGIDMALGVRPMTIALRPLLGAAWISVLGVVFGMGMGLLFVRLLGSLFQSVLPLPVWITPLEARPFLAAASLGFIIPFAACAWPVWRAVRVQPVDAIRTGHLAARGGGLARFVKRLHLPGRSLVQIPFRNLVRAPRRTILTAIGIGAAMTTLVVVTGSLDSFNQLLARISSEAGSGAKGRLVVTLAGFEPAGSPLVRSIEDMPSTGEVERGLVLPVRASNAGDQVNVALEATDMKSPVWHPTVSNVAPAAGLPGIVLSSKAASDLHLASGDALEVRHPYRTGASLFGVRTTRMRLVGLHANPIRLLAYTDIANAPVFGLAGFTNQLQVVPAEGYTTAQVKRDLFAMPGVAVVQAPTEAADLTREYLASYTGVYRAMDAFVLFLALLIAFNAASIGFDERARENATMMAFGVRPKTIVRMSCQESAVIGLLGSLVGLGLGLLFLGWLVAQLASTLPDIELLVTLRPATIATVVVFGIVVVGLAPLLTTRKLRRADVPSTLRVME